MSVPRISITTPRMATHLYLPVRVNARPERTLPPIAVSINGIRINPLFVADVPSTP
jgi:hypothetical protein